MGGGGSKKGTSTVVQQPGPPEIAAEFKPFAKEVGDRALTHLDEFNLSDFAGNNALAVPGLNDMQAGALDRINQRFYGGIPTPQGETDLYSLMNQALGISNQTIGQQGQEYFAQNQAANLPGVAGQRVNTDPLRYDQYGRSLNVQDRVSDAIGEQQYEQAGAEALGQFAGGDLANSPAIQAAVQQIANTVTPLVGNQMAKAGLGRSGAMASELQNQMTGTLLPLFMQGLQQQQAAGTQLAGIGSNLAARQENALQREMGMENLLENVVSTIAGRNEALDTESLNRYLQAVSQTQIPTFLELGNRMAGREADTINRQLQTAGQQYGALAGISDDQSQRDTQALNEMIQGGALDRDIAGQQAEAQHADMLRRQALAEVFHTAMLGSIPSLTTFPSVSTETTKTPSSK